MQKKLLVRKGGMKYTKKQVLKVDWGINFMRNTEVHLKYLKKAEKEEMS